MKADSVIARNSGMNVRTITEFLRLLGNPAEENQICNALGDTASISGVVRLLHGRGLKADFKRVRLDRSARTPMPALAVMKGHYYCSRRCHGRRALDGNRA